MRQHILCYTGTVLLAFWLGQQWPAVEPRIPETQRFLHTQERDPGIRHAPYMPASEFVRL